MSRFVRGNLGGFYPVRETFNLSCEIKSSLVREDIGGCYPVGGGYIISFHPSAFQASSLCQIGKNFGNYLKNFKKFVKIRM